MTVATSSPCHLLIVPVASFKASMEVQYLHVGSSVHLLSDYLPGGHSYDVCMPAHTSQSY